jgi:co-chaperonin GroES (HSP10)
MKSLQLLKDNMLVGVHEKAFIGRFFIPEIHRDQHDYRTGTVAYVGMDVKEIEPGDIVVLDFGGQWTRIDGVLYAVVKERNVLAVLEKEEVA